MEALARARQDVKLRIVDVGDWHSPVAEQFGIRSLPTIWLYEDGKLFSKDRAAVGARLQALK